MTARRGQRAAVVGYWHAVEMFSPQQIPAVAPRKRVYEARADRPMPWETGHVLQRERLEKGYVWQHVVYGGVYTFASVRNALLKVFGGDEENHDSRLDSQSALFAFTVNKDGRLLLESPIFGTCPWATGRALASEPGGPRWLDGFELEAEAWLQRAAELGEELDPEPPTVHEQGQLAPPEGDDVDEEPAEAADPQLSNRTIGYGDLVAFTAALAQEWGVAEVLEPVEIRVRSVAVREDQATDADQQDFLNSFVAADLSMIMGQLRSTDPGPALDTYLTAVASVRHDQRVDLRSDPAAALGQVLPDRTPAGRWPAEPGHPLALSQQVAVNAGQRELAEGGGLFAVNGPPGTGKTTALRDHFAAVIVERARRLAELRMPSQAFESDKAKKHTWKSAEYDRTVIPLIPALTGFEMVVASSNNGAVQNISTEIPARKALGEQWEQSADYLADQATRLLKGRPAWGAVAARLGRKQYREEFVNRFWYGNRKESDDAPEQTPAQGRDPWIGTKNGLVHLLAEWRDTRQTGVWREAREAFQQADRKVEALRAERQAAAKVLAGAVAAADAVEAARLQAEHADAQVTRLEQELRDRARPVAKAREAAAEAQQALDRHTAGRPGFSVSLFTVGRAAREWQDRNEVLTAAADAKRAVRDQQVAAEEWAAEQLRIGRETAARARQAVGAAERTLAGVEAVQQDAYARWGAHVPDQAWLWDEAARELSAPWADEEFTTARSELFLAALELHRALLRCAAKTMRNNLLAAMDVVTGAVPPTLSAEARLAAWQNVFLVVPVLSTTFASLHRMFTGLGAEALGWLFIDEAGQAAPQLAVGALWRSRRAVVVGDPLQLEPVVILPFTVQQALGRELGVSEDWLPSRTSAQQIADRHNRLGTTLKADQPDGSDEVWVGAPLRVHRRCEDPMFTVCNDIAYDGMMVYGTRYSTDSPYRFNTSWVHVASTVSEGHWIPAEGVALVQMLKKMRDENGVDLDRQVFVLSPFRDVVNGAQRVTKNLMDPDRVGTVHTAQGKEADIVILLLGTDPKKPGTRGWAAKKPNLLNVAVSRAKRRLYVIGNHEKWQELPYFETLAEQIPVHRFVAADTPTVSRPGERGRSPAGA